MRKIVTLISLAVLSLRADAQVISTIAGGGPEDFTEGCDATATKLNAPFAIAVDDAGNVYFTEPDLCVVRKIDVNGKMTTLAGTGTAGYTGNGVQATTAQLYQPYGVTTDHSGNVYIADTRNNVIRKVSPTGIISTYQSGIGEPFDLAMHSNGKMYVSTGTGNAVIRMNAGGGHIITVAGGFVTDIPHGPYGYTGDLWWVSNARLSGVAVDEGGTVYIADFWENIIRKKTETGGLTTFAGHSTGIGYGSYGGDGGPAIPASLDGPKRICLDKAGNVVFSDSRNGRIRRVGADGKISTIVGGGTGGDGSMAVNALLNEPMGVAFDTAGNMYIADIASKRIRKVSPEGTAVRHTAAARADIRIVPNPSNGVFAVNGKWQDDKKVSVDVINTMGSVVYKTSLTVTNGSIDAQMTPELASGNYLLRVSGDNKVSTYPFVVAR